MALEVAQTGEVAGVAGLALEMAGIVGVADVDHC